MPSHKLYAYLKTTNLITMRSANVVFGIVTNKHELILVNVKHTCSYNYNATFFARFTFWVTMTMNLTSGVTYLTTTSFASLGQYVMVKGSTCLLNLLMVSHSHGYVQKSLKHRITDITHQNNYLLPKESLSKKQLIKLIVNLQLEWCFKLSKLSSWLVLQHTLYYMLTA